MTATSSAADSATGREAFTTGRAVHGHQGPGDKRLRVRAERASPRAASPRPDVGPRAVAGRGRGCDGVEPAGELVVQGRIARGPLREAGPRSPREPTRGPPRTRSSGPRASSRSLMRPRIPTPSDLDRAAAVCGRSGGGGTGRRRAARDAQHEDRVPLSQIALAPARRRRSIWRSPSATIRTSAPSTRTA